jgi:hypothetical protein
MPKKSVIALAVLALILACLPVAQAAEQAKLKIDVSVDRPETFWACTFVTSDDMVVGKPAKIVLKYSLGLSGVKEKSETIITQGKKSGTFSLDTDKNELVNLEVLVFDAANHKLGSSGFQVRNNGQLEFIVVGPPPVIEPRFNWGATAAPDDKTKR